MIQVIPLGAGQDVGRSCIIIKLGGKTIMLDCGIHMSMQDERKFPDFSLISKTNQFSSCIDCILITHFHLDHCGALPYFTEHCKYSGPIIMTHPTRAICPILLEDLRKILSDKRAEYFASFFTSENIRNCMRKVTCINLLESVFLDNEFEIRAYYAGHVLGAAMFYIRVGTESVVYTGDFNTTPDRHLGAAWIDRLRANVFITESTYATTIRDSKRTRERDFLKKIHESIQAGGKVLIPTFAVGRAQELFLLLESYLDRSQLDIPVYFSAALTEKANKYYKLFVNWTNQRLKQTFHTRNLFDFRRVKPFERAYIDEARPMILFASPGMLNSGFSLEVLKAWAHDSRNLLVIPGYCAPDTIGAKLLAGQRKLDIDRVTTIEVAMKIEHFSFSAHADAKGILQLIGQCEPSNVVLVHGEKAKMSFLKEQIERECKIPCFYPANGECLKIDTKSFVSVGVSQEALKRKIELSEFNVPFNGILLEQPTNQLGLFSPDEINPTKHGKFLIKTECSIESGQWDILLLSDESLGNAQFTPSTVSNFIYQKFKRLFPKVNFGYSLDNSITIHSIRIQFIQQEPFKIQAMLEWDYYDNDIADILSRHLNILLD